MLSFSDRRSFLTRMFRFLQAGIALFLAIPIIRYLVSSTFAGGPSEGVWSTVGNLADIPVGEPQKRTFIAAERDGWSERLIERSVWVVHNPDDQATVFTATCPHLGCA